MRSHGTGGIGGGQGERSSALDGVSEVILLSESIKWSWACRILGPTDYHIDPSHSEGPTVGDLALVRVEQIGYHGSIVDVNNRKSRLYVGDLIVGVFGNRYATDALEAEVNGLRNLSLLTSAGMFGTVKSRHQDFGSPTNVSFVGFLSDANGQRINLKRLRSRDTAPKPLVKNLIAIVGTGMNSGKTTCASKLIKELYRGGFKVGACKLTGSVSNRDQDEMRSAYAKAAVDFSDYGFPSTYLSSKEELLGLFNAMLSDLEKANPDLVLVEIADGVLQRETSMLLADPTIREMITGIVVTADGAPAALYAVENLRKSGHQVIAVSGKITSSPLYVREFEKNCDVKVGSSADSGKELAEIVTRFVWPSTVNQRA